MIDYSKPSIRIPLLITIFPLIPLFLYGVFSHLFFINAQHKVIDQDINNIKTTIMEIEQQNLEEKVSDLSQFISYHDQNNKQQARNEIKNFIYLASDIANNIYHKNKDQISEAQLKKRILGALNHTNYGSEINYLFLLNLDGKVLIHRDDAIVNTNSLEIRDVTGRYIIHEFLRIFENADEGFTHYFWYKDPQEKDVVYSKTTFVKVLDAYDWYIGAGVRTESFLLYKHKELLSHIKKNSAFKDGYLFISDSKDALIFQSNNTHIEDFKNLRVEGFYKDDHQIAYTRYIAEFDWYITAVKEMDAIRENIELKRQQSTQSISDKTTTNIYLVGLSWLISLVLSLYLSWIIYRILKRYKVKLDDTNEKLIFQSRQATIGELMPMIAHQWRQPINKMASTLALIRFQILANHLDIKELDKRCLSIEDNLEFMSETIDDFSNFYKPNDIKSEASLNKLIMKSIHFFDSRLKKNGIEIHTELEDIQHNLFGNEFMQVMINIIENAIDAAPEKDAIIRIKLYKNQENNIVITIDDNGHSIDKSSIQKIFSPYYSTKSGSMGLGLYMSKMIVEDHLNGHISVESLATGTRFIVVI